MSQNTILVAIDGSDGSKRALAAAVEHAVLTQSKMLLAHVIEWSPYSFHTPEELSERHQRRESEIERANDTILEPEKASLADKGVEISTMVRHGKTAQTLIDIAEESGASQIYIGKLGESTFRSMLFGSVTAALVQAAPVPVTVIP